MKIIGAILLIGFFISPVFAQCNCTTDEIINTISYASKEKKQELFSSLLESSSFSPGYAITNYFARIINASRDERVFKEAMRYYIENYCKVQNGNIVCN